MKRRAFIQGLMGIVTSAMVPAGGDGVMLESAAHPAPAILPTFGDPDTGIFASNDDTFGLSIGGIHAKEAQRLASALARSMIETREQVTANVLNRAFDIDPALLEEIEIDVD